MASKKPKRRQQIDERGGHAPPVAASGRQVPPASSVTTKEAVVLFMEAGFPRSLRSVERYCKKGRLEAFLHPDEETYYIPRESVDALIEQFRETQERRLNTQPTGVATDPPTGADRGGHAPPVAAIGSKKVEELEEELEEVTNERNSARIDAEARQMVINQMNKAMREEREHFTTLIQLTSRRNGELEERLLQLEGPRDASKEGKSPTPPEDGGKS